MKATVAVIVYTASVIASLLIGANIGERKAMTHASIGVNDIQADLLFNRVLDERKMQSMLSKGCVSEATLELDINEDQDMKLLAKFFSGELTTQARRYISDRDPGLAKTLTTFESKYGDSWVEVSCKK